MAVNVAAPTKGAAAGAAKATDDPSVDVVGPTPWRAVRTLVDLLLIVVAAAPVILYDPDKLQADQVKAMGALFTLVILPFLATSSVAVDTDARSAARLREIGRLTPLALVPSAIALLLFPTAARWGALEVCLVGCCPFAFLMPVPRARSLLRMNLGLVAIGASVLDPQAAPFVLPAILLILCAIALEHFESVHVSLAYRMPARVGVALGVGAGAFLLVVVPMATLLLAVLPRWERDLGGERTLLPALPVQTDGPPLIVKLAAVAAAMWAAWWLLSHLFEGRGRLMGRPVEEDEGEVDELLPPEIIDLGDPFVGRPRRAWSRPRSAVIDAWLVAEVALAARGLERGKGEPAGSYAAAVSTRVREQAGDEAADALVSLASAFDRARYGPIEPTDGDVATARDQGGAVRSAARRVQRRRDEA